MVHLTHLAYVALLLTSLSSTTATTPSSDPAIDPAEPDRSPRQFIPYTPALAEKDDKKHFYLWSTCQSRFPDCTRCPNHPKCRQQPQSASSNPTIESAPKSEFRFGGKRKGKKARNPMEGGEMNALSGPQIWWPLRHDPVEDTNNAPASSCPLRTCSEPATEQCGDGAMCRNGLCACPRGFKASGGAMGRGLSGREGLVVHVDVGVGCDVRCQSLRCREVERLRACFGGGGTAGSEKVESSDGSMGAIKAPGGAVGGIA